MERVIAWLCLSITYITAVLRDYSDTGRLPFKVAFMKLNSVFMHLPKSWDYVGAQSNGLCE